MLRVVSAKLRLPTAIILGLSLLLPIFSLLFVPQQALAADTKNFDPENIISDAIFTDSNSMSVDQIQQFLVNKNSVCLKNFKTLSLHDANNDGLGDEPYGKGKNEKVSAAQVIWQAAQLYRINPKVILATLQKEQGLITRTDCPTWRYNTALGYGCPDHQPCDNTAYGFTRQIDYGVWHFRGFFDDSYPIPPYTPGNTFIAYNPDSSCGGKTIKIRNRATAALYSYTPYQPNAATLAAAPGQTVNCGAYGNLNFWRYFTDWFGSTIIPIAFKTPSSSQIYLLSGESYVKIQSTALLNAYGFDHSDVGTVPASTLNSLQNGGTLTNVARFGGDEVYLIDNGKRYQFPNPATLSLYGYTMGAESKLDPSIRDLLTSAGSLTDIVQVSGRPEIYLIEAGKKRHISSKVAFQTLGTPVYNTRPSVTLSTAYVSTLPDGAPILLDGDLITATDTKRTWIYLNNSRQRIDDTVASAWGLTPTYTATAATLDQLPLSATVHTDIKAKLDGNNLYLLDGKKKYKLSPTETAKLGLTEADFPTVSDKLLNYFVEQHLPTHVRKIGTDPVFKITDGELYHAFARDDLAYYNLSLSNTTSISQKMLDVFKNTGKVLLMPGRLVRVGNTDGVFIIDDNMQKRHIPSREILDQHGLKLANVISLSAAQLAGYPTASKPFGRFISYSDGSYWLVDKVQRLKLLPSQFSDYNLSADDFIDVATLIIQRLPKGATLTNIVSDPKGKVYKIENGKKRWFKTRQSFESQNSWSNVRQVSEQFVELYPDGPAI